MSIKKMTFAFVLFFHCVLLYSQTPPFYRYTSSDGLASSTVYQTLQDREGFIWFATQNGISKFDGKNFSTYRIKDGLNSNSIISLAEGAKGELYIGNYEKGVNVIKNGKIENFFLDTTGNQFPITNMFVMKTPDGKSRLYTHKYYAHINALSLYDGKKTETSRIELNPPHTEKIGNLPNGEIILLTRKGLYILKNNIAEKLAVKGLPDISFSSITAGNDSSYYVGSDGIVFKIKNNRVVKSYDVNLVKGKNEIFLMLNDRNGNLWFSITNSGFFLIPNGSNEIINIGIKMDLQFTNVNNFLEDREGNVWISTYGKGAFCLNNLYIKSYNEKDGMSSNNVYSIVNVPPKNLFIGTFNGVNALENGRFKRVQSKANPFITEYIYEIKHYNNEIYVCGVLSGSKVKPLLYKGSYLYWFDQLSICKTKSGLYLLGTGGNHFLIFRNKEYNRNKSPFFFVFGSSDKPNRIDDIFEDSDNNIWVGTGLGLCRLSNFSESNGIYNWDKTFFTNNVVLSSRIHSLYQDKKRNVWIAADKGIASYNLDNGKIKTYTNIKGYDLSSATSLASDNKGRIWIGNMKGLYQFDGSSIKYLNTQTGLTSDEVFSLNYDENENLLYIGTSNGISILDINLFDRYTPPLLNVKILGIKAGDSVYTNYNNLVLEPEQHNVYINFVAVNFSSPGSVKYKYKLNEDDWLETDNNFLDFTSLEHGTYELQIAAKSQNAEWSKPTLVTFRLLPRFVETIWFFILIVALIILISVFIVLKRIQNLNKKNRLENELTERINELKHQALSAMMNPHFIFNSLNSVQFLVNSERLEEANDYIAMMAKLMRKNLDTAGQGFILLSEEINRLQLYLDLEKLRFQDSFTYEIIIGEDVNTVSTMIPNMIIQPFVENSLWHGIINSGKKGSLTISFSFEDVDIDSIIIRSLIIKVTDNGVGINEAKKNRKEDHISKGILIIEERLRLLSTKMELPQPIMFEDLSSRDKNSHGTEVVISLPPPLYKISVPE